MMPLFGAIILFCIFTANVVLGALGRTPFLGNVGEMLVLVVAAVMFVAAILKSEAAARKKAAQQRP